MQAPALAADPFIGTALTRIGLPSLAPLPAWHTLAFLGFAALSCLGVNDLLKVVLLKRLAPAG